MMDQTTSGVRVAYPLRAARIKARERRLGAAIRGYTGTNGGGKTMAAVFDLLPSLAAGRPIVSTCRILDPRTGEPHPLWVPLDDFRVLLDLSDCDVLLDEVTGVASARDSMSLPSAVLNHLMQLRKDDVTLSWTTPNWRRADTGIREVTQALTTCVGLMPLEAQERTDYGTVRRWQQRRLFVWRTYDAIKFDEWSTAKERSSSKAHRVKPIARQVVWGPGSITRDCYDTYEHALSLGAASDSGTCMDCGAQRTRKKCVCETKGAPIRDASTGMLRWDVVKQTRRHLGETFTAEDLPPHGWGRRRLLIPETDDTPGVVVETSPAA